MWCGYATAHNDMEKLHYNFAADISHERVITVRIGQVLLASATSGFSSYIAKACLLQNG